MSIRIRKLKPQDALSFVEFFEDMDFQHNEFWRGCYCQYYHLQGSIDKWIETRGEKARNMALINVARAYTQGYLALDGERIVGWCHVNHQAKLLRLTEFLRPWLGEGKTAVVACFMVHPAYRRQGIAARLLEAAVQGCQEEGFSAILGLPSKENPIPEREYHGRAALYERLGFQRVAEIEGQLIYKKDLSAKIEA